MANINTDGSPTEAALAAAAAAALTSWAAKRIGLRGGARAALTALSAANGAIGAAEASTTGWSPRALRRSPLDSTWALPNTSPRWRSIPPRPSTTTPTTGPN